MGEKDIKEKIINKILTGSNFYFYGQFGVGKTYKVKKLAESLRANFEYEVIMISKKKNCTKEELKKAMEENKLILISGFLTKIEFITLNDYYSQLKKEMKKEEDFYPIKKKLKESELLIFDDIGAEKISNWSIAELFEILNYRMEKSLPIIYTSNYSIENLEKKYKKSVIEYLTIERLFERIKTNTTQILIKGTNKRDKNINKTL